MPGVTWSRSGGFAWREAGTADAPPLLLLHGLGGTAPAWDAQLTGLGDRLRVAAWDLPGYGDSAPLDAPTTFATLAAAVGAWADELGIDTFHLGGISMGGMIAQYAAAAMPGRVRSLSILSSSPKFGLDGTLPADWRARRLAPLDAGQQPADFASAVLHSLAGPHVAEDVIGGQIAAMRRVPADGLRRSIDCLITHDTRAILPGIQAPALVLVGALDDETPPAYSQAIADLLPHATLQVVPGAGHLLNVEAPDAVNAAIAAHVTAVEQRAAS